MWLFPAVKRNGIFFSFYFAELLWIFDVASWLHDQLIHLSYFVNNTLCSWQKSCSDSNLLFFLDTLVAHPASVAVPTRTVRVPPRTMFKLRHFSLKWDFYSSSFPHFQIIPSLVTYLYIISAAIAHNSHSDFSPLQLFLNIQLPPQRGWIIKWNYESVIMTGLSLLAPAGVWACVSCSFNP